MTLGKTQDAALGHLRNVHPQKWLNDFTRREGFRLLTLVPRHSSSWGWGWQGANGAIGF